MRNDRFPGEIAALMVDAGKPPLSGWYANPLLPLQIEQLLHFAESRLRQRVQPGNVRFLPAIIELIAQFAEGADVQMHFNSLKSVVCDRKSMALLHLIYGQLLISCKLSPAFELLNQGFNTAAGSLEPAGYFAVLKRHELLQWLPVSQTRCEPSSLDDLLNEAQVIRQLGDIKNQQTRLNNNHKDTLD